jgi:hypothetical protein
MPSALSTLRVSIDVGDLAVSNKSDLPLGADALSSCFGALTIDPVSRAASLPNLELTYSIRSNTDCNATVVSPRGESLAQRSRSFPSRLQDRPNPSSPPGSANIDAPANRSISASTERRGSGERGMAPL